ncbi:sugar phosphate isomerase/epimerase [Paenibacillus sp. LHD-38]|uniref:sugar phosphate isomerase/epimerase family protein n=1 Tax=Paenibacillus sp. LHD-38 TaxID=3072143 RepID=UPI00280E332E|nr:sugar phosphate isomerase/epimerase [Paenibacillus sp. LHD-38]MDQ8733926.1 sugar phosphate isomerase/epimerase [Paenibacillus sp. LHD-38]
MIILTLYMIIENTVMMCQLGAVDDLCDPYSIRGLNWQLDAVIEKHKIWDCKYVGLGAMPLEYRNSKEGYLTFAKEATEIGRKLNQAGLRFFYHNHEFEFAKFNGKTGMEILMEEMDPDAVDFLIDLFWVQAGGADPIEWLHKLKGRMTLVHLKDYAVTSDRERRFAEVGVGNMNYPPILEACKSLGIEWAPVEQDNCYGRDPFESLAKSFNNLIELGAEA